MEWLEEIVINIIAVGLFASVLFYFIYGDELDSRRRAAKATASTTEVNEDGSSLLKKKSKKKKKKKSPKQRVVATVHSDDVAGEIAIAAEATTGKEIDDEGNRSMEAKTNDIDTIVESKTVEKRFNVVEYAAARTSVEEKGGSLVDEVGSFEKKIASLISLGKGDEEKNGIEVSEVKLSLPETEHCEVRIEEGNLTDFGEEVQLMRIKDYVGSESRYEDLSCSKNCAIEGVSCSNNADQDSGPLAPEQVLENEKLIHEKVGVDDRGEYSLDDEDGWEAVERSVVEELFGLANAYVGSRAGADAVSKLNSDVQMQLLGLHKVATEGPCSEPQPIALKVTARAKWHAWQRLGKMDREVAMEKYMVLLSQNIPGWMGEKPAVCPHIKTTAVRFYSPEAK